MKIIIGASGGIGSKLFEHYPGSVGTFLSHGVESEFMYNLDVTYYEDVENFAESVDITDGRLELINCAGITYDAMAHKSNPIAWDEVIHVNLIGTYNVIRAFLPYMRKHNYGRIVNMGSVVAQSGTPGTSAYAASKAGLWGLTKAIAKENLDKGITINTLNLGYMAVGMATDLTMKGPLISIHNLINAIDFLVNSDFVTGTSIDINGGLI